MWIYVTPNVYSSYVELANKLNNNINIVQLPNQYVLNSVSDYNKIILDISFWTMLQQFERVLIFQMDSMIYRKGIELYYEYDYIGAPWDPSWNISKSVGNGGLSLRNIQAMIYCLQNKNKVIINNYFNKKENDRIFGGPIEDVFYSHAMIQFGFKVPNSEIASQFSIEAYMYNKNCLGSHKLDVFNNNLYNELLTKSIIEYNIPLKIYQTWHTKKLIKNLQECSDSIKNNNPEFEYYLYDDNDCRQFIKNNFDQEILWAYDKLIPGAFKADLWRYYILYKNGGIYINIKYKCVNNFKLIYIIDKEYHVLDRTCGWHEIQKGIYSGLLIFKKNNLLLLNLINNIIENVRSNFYGLNSLHPTGPLLIGILYEKYYKEIKVDEFELKYSEDGVNICLNNQRILEIYNEYRNDLVKYSNTKHYGELWIKKNIYNL
jgi:hypothetical protein